MTLVTFRTDMTSLVLNRDENQGFRNKAQTSPQTVQLGAD